MVKRRNLVFSEKCSGTIGKCFPVKSGSPQSKEFVPVCRVILGCNPRRLRTLVKFPEKFHFKLCNKATKYLSSLEGVVFRKK